MDLLYINNQRIELDGVVDIKITKQVNDIAKLDKRQDSYTNTIKIPKTKNNVKALDALSLNGDMSRIPYKKNECIFIRDGVQLINKGWAIIKSTEVSYSLYVYEGIIDLFKDIDNHTLGDYLNLSEINHVKSMDTVISSFKNENYCYLIADYNGKTHAEGKINIDYLVPSARVKYISQKIQEKTGWYFDGEIFHSEEFKNMWLSYPNPLVEDKEETNIMVAELDKPAFSIIYNQLLTIPAEEMPNDPNYKFWNSNINITQDEAALEADNWSIKVLQDGDFNCKFTLSGHVYHLTEHLGDFPGAWEPKTYYVKTMSQMQVLIYVDGLECDSAPILGDSEQSGIFNEFIFDKEVLREVVIPDLKAGQVITFKIKPYFGGTKRVVGAWIPSHSSRSAFRGSSLVVKKFQLNIDRLNAGVGDFNKALEDFKINDFIKEIICHFGLTIYMDKYDKVAYFLTMKERLHKAKVYDFSDYYKGRSKEQYQLTSYAQKNRFRHQYNDEKGDYNDGIIVIDDINLDNEKTVINSVIYTHEREDTDFLIEPGISRTLDIFKIWEKEPNENNGVLEIKYKGLSKRFYWLRKKEEKFNSPILTSEILRTDRKVETLPLADYSRLRFDEIVEDNYSEITKILNDTRIHTIELSLPLPLVSIFDMAGLYYFKQEGQYYFCNKLHYSKSNVTGEFIRVQYEPQEIGDTPRVDKLLTSPMFAEFNCMESDEISISNVEVIVYYFRGNGDSYEKMVVESDQGPTFTATLETGVLNKGSDGEIIFTISGTLPSNERERTFTFTLFGLPIVLNYNYKINKLTQILDRTITVINRDILHFKVEDFPFIDDQYEKLEAIRFTDLSGMHPRAILDIVDEEVEEMQEITIDYVEFSNITFEAPSFDAPSTSVLVWQGKTESGCWSREKQLTIITLEKSNTTPIVGDKIINLGIRESKIIYLNDFIGNTSPLTNLYEHEIKSIVLEKLTTTGNAYTSKIKYNSIIIDNLENLIIPIEDINNGLLEHYVEFQVDYNGLSMYLYHLILDDNTITNSANLNIYNRHILGN